MEERSTDSSFKTDWVDKGWFPPRALSMSTFMASSCFWSSARRMSSALRLTTMDTGALGITLATGSTLATGAALAAGGVVAAVSTRDGDASACALGEWQAASATKTRIRTASSYARRLANHPREGPRSTLPNGWFSVWH